MILSPASAVGIDIERYSSRVDRVASRFLRDDEVVLPFRGETLWSLLLHWSAKETVYKCMENPDATSVSSVFPVSFLPKPEWLRCKSVLPGGIRCSRWAIACIPTSC